MRRTVMILATTTVENVDRFLDVFGTKVADKRPCTVPGVLRCSVSAASSPRG
jgi:hypothetical protein